MFKKCIAVIILLLVIITNPAISVYANEIDYHEDPETAGEIFSGIALLQYYSDSLDTILQKNPEETERLLAIMPYANIPDKLDSSTGEFNSYSITLSYAIDVLDSLWQRESELLSRYQLDEAKKIREQIDEELLSAFNSLDLIKSATESIGSFLRIDMLSAQSDIKTIYNEILDKLQRIEDMLDLFRRRISDIEIPGITPEQLQELLKPENSEQLANIINEIFSPTVITLAINPSEAFVGDWINITVLLTSDNKPLPGRNVVLVLNGIQYLDVTTDEQGYYLGILQVPYWYIPEIEIRAIYYPEGADIGTYLGSVSQSSTLLVKYYSAKLDLSVKGQAYPAKSLALYGTLKYEDSPVINNRLLNIYLDDSFNNEVITGTYFETPINIPAEIALGNHTIIASSAANGRYAPLIAFLSINVSQAQTYLDLSLPGLSLIPGTINVSGDLYSELGPLNNAVITLDMNRKVTQSQSSIGGTFTGSINKGMELSLLGYQQVTIYIQPSEPWNAPLETTRDIYIINFANIGIILVVLVITSVILRVKTGGRHRIYRKLSTGLIEDILPEPISLTKTKIGKDTVILWNKREKSGLYTHIIDWYIRALKVVAEITSLVLQPHQTIREYAEQTGPKLGLIQKVFNEFTRYIEKLLYSGYKPTEEDVAISRSYSDTIRKERL
jgi:hypothetical protein